MPRGTVIPVVTCMIPCPQSKETSAGPEELNATPEIAIVMRDSTQAMALSSVGGSAAGPGERAPRAPVSTAGSWK